MNVRVIFQTALALALVAPAAAAQGFRFVVSTGVHNSTVRHASFRPPLGASVEATAHIGLGSGFSLGPGFRYIGYDRVADRCVVFADFRYTARARSSGTGLRPIVGLRAGVFAGGDEGGDDPYIGFEGGPIFGTLIPLGKRADLQLLGSLMAARALFGGVRAYGGLQIGVALH